MAFSATDAAFEGFRIGRHKPQVMLAWAAASLVISLISSIAMVALFGDTLNEMMAMQGATNTDPAQTMALLGRMGQLYLVLAPVALLVFSVFTSAVYRAVLRPADSAFAYLRLGATELRIAVVILVLSIMSFVATFLLMIVVGILAAIMGVAAVGSGDGGAMMAGFLIIAVAYVVMLLALLGFWVKFSFAAPMTFAEGRIRIFESWDATRGRFWPLFGCYVLSLVLGVVVSLLGSAIGLAVMAALGGAGGAGNITDLFRSIEADYSSLASFMTPAVLVNMVISSIFSALTYAIFLAPPAVAYREITARNSPAVAETFG